MIVRNIINLASCFCFILLLLSCNKINPEELTGDYVYAEIDGKQYKTQDHEVPTLVLAYDYDFLLIDGGEIDMVTYELNRVPLSPVNDFWSSKKVYFTWLLRTLMDEQQTNKRFIFSNGFRKLIPDKQDIGGFISAVGISDNGWIQLDSHDKEQQRIIGQFEFEGENKNGKKRSFRNGRFALHYVVSRD